MPSRMTPLEAAIDWMVLLRSGEASAHDRERHRAWCAADPRHASAWAQVSGAVQGAMDPLRAAQTASSAQGAALQTALLRPRRRAVRGLLALAGVAVGAGWLLQRQGTLPALLADLRTGTGERRSLTLADGSRLVLNARSAVDVDFTSAERRLRLREGEVIASVAPDAARPFVVASAEGTVRALGTRFLVRQEAGRSFAAVLEHSVRVRTLGGDESTVQAGGAVWFDAARITLAPVAAANATAWERGMLVADDRPLGEVVQALRAYRGGFIRITPDAAALRVLGAFPLDDPERVLQSLAQTLPIRVTRYGAWLVLIERSGSGA